MQQKTLFFFFFLINLTSCGTSKSSVPIDIVTGIAPISTLIQTIVGTNLTVTNIISYDADPHHFQLKGKDALLIAQAEMVLAIDTHIDAYLLSVDRDNNKIILLNDENYSFVEIHDHHSHEHGDHNHKINSHIWLSYIHAEELAYKILNVLSIEYPELKEIFQRNTEKFISRLHLSQQKILAERSTNIIYAIQRHHAWDYLLKELRIPLLGTLEEIEGATVSLNKMVSLTEKIKDLPQDATIVFIDDAYSQESSSLKQLAIETKSKVFPFNPMVIPSGKTDIVDILEYHSTQLLQ